MLRMLLQMRFLFALMNTTPNNQDSTASTSPINSLTSTINTLPRLLLVQALSQVVSNLKASRRVMAKISSSLTAWSLVTILRSMLTFSRRSSSKMQDRIEFWALARVFLQTQVNSPQKSLDLRGTSLLPVSWLQMSIWKPKTKSSKESSTNSKKP